MWRRGGSLRCETCGRSQKVEKAHTSGAGTEHCEAGVHAKDIVVALMPWYAALDVKRHFLGQLFE